MQNSAWLLEWVARISRFIFNCLVYADASLLREANGLGHELVPIAPIDLSELLNGLGAGQLMHL